MKRPLLIIVSVMAMNYSYAQNTFPWKDTGNVGIGTANPVSKLTVFEEGDRNSYVTVGNNFVATLFGAGGNQFGIVGTSSDHDLAFYTHLKENMRLTSNGNVGIGTRTPANKLSIFESSNSNSYITVENNSVGTLFGVGGDQIGIVGTSSNHDLTFFANMKEKMRLTRDGNVGIGTSVPDNKLTISNSNNSNTYVTAGNNTVNTLFGAGGTTVGIVGTISNHDLAFFTNLKEKMRLTRDGNVGIGIENPMEKLSVNGNIRCKELLVETANWPDYVFKEDYQLLSLAELEKYIEKNRHLPEFPSEQEVAKEGVNVGEMNRLLVKKIEELTLYLLEKDKQLKDQTEKLNNLQLSIIKSNAEFSRELHLLRKDVVNAAVEK
ncbi:hypothetical protein HDE69_004272 [Pedobacter cryoconitis]|uniref:Peptidase S74 domain-containing protein n=1 Tax=Pedobacter cryoconitis TaxID=188932 RepID=A0A7W8YWM8_9SPHI|nr:hypothetical protein [Pedobacter cryoconitis]MBB5623189.1 hypothetical protein [Pedobacter cryoconitis]